MEPIRLDAELRDLILTAPIVDTHEHLVEESSRLRPVTDEDRASPFSFNIRWRQKGLGVLFSHYMDSDLVVAGMPEADLQVLWDPDAEPGDKWRRAKPYWERAKNTGYGLNVRESLLALFGEGDITDGNWEALDGKLRALVKPGFHDLVLRQVSNIDHCQVNSLETEPFMETGEPDLLLQDIAFSSIANVGNVDALAERMSRDIATIDDWEEAIAWAFDQWGPKAVAAKSNQAYNRPLDYALVSKDEARGAFERLRKGGGAVRDGDWKAVSDYSFHESVRHATRHGLPVKLHTGYYAGHNGMPLSRLRTNASDMCALCAAHRDARFVFMHITYPYQDEAIAVAKHYSNAWIDMCWAWAVNPAASLRFLKEFLVAAPANKVFPFGADYGVAELVPGHGRMARRGIARALAELVDEGWLHHGQCEGIARRLLAQNAYELFPIERAKAATKQEA